MENIIQNPRSNESVKYCKRCHRKLKDSKSAELGFGKICYKKYIEKQQKNYLFNMEN